MIKRKYIPEHLGAWIWLIFSTVVSICVLIWSGLSPEGIGAAIGLWMALVLTREAAWWQSW